MDPSPSPASPPRVPVRAYPRALRAPLAAAAALGWGALLALASSAAVLPMTTGEALPSVGAPAAAAVLLAALRAAGEGDRA